MRPLAAKLLIPLIAVAGVIALACNGGGTSVLVPTAVETPTPVEDTLTRADSEQGELTTAELVEQLRPAVVHILTETATLDIFGQIIPEQGVGTGVIIDTEGHIVTNNHVITRDGGRAVEKITVTLSDERKFAARIVGRDPATDLAVLQIDADNLNPARFGDSSQVQVGDEVVAIGNALDLPGGPTVTKGVVSAKDRFIQEEPFTIPGAIQTDAAINPGNSGGPLVNMRGEVIGITTAVIRGGAEGVGFAISTETLEPVVAELLEKGKVERGYLGISLVDITPSLARNFDLPVEEGVGIQRVQPGSPAHRAGLRAGDIIVAIGQQEVRHSGDLLQALTEHQEGERVSVRFWRDGQQRETEVTLGRQPR